MIYGTFVEAFGEFSKEIRFLSRAVYRDEGCYPIRHILIEPSDVEPGKFRGVSTDGRRLHVVDPLSCSDDIGVEPGNWRPLKTNSKCSWMAHIPSNGEQFPPYRKVIPHDEPAFASELPGMPLGSRMLENMPYLDKFFREFPEPTVINMNHIDALDCSRDWTVKWYGSNKAVLFESGKYTAVIMSMRTNDETGGA
jgi:hypothetical protein